MSLMGRHDTAVLWRMLRGMPGRGTEQEKLDRFYRPQAAGYDAFRERLLHGRREMIELLAVPAGASVVELGAGTGRNLAFFGERLRTLARIDLVDLCPALLEQARRRCGRWPNVRVVEADATTWQPEEPVDAVYLSYALTMIPQWQHAADNAVAMLKPGGRLGIVDFTVSPARHGALAGWLWQRWFAHDGVRLDAAHLPYLSGITTEIARREALAPMPYLPGLRAPYYLYVGRKA
jgi:S-adenosylmethionine-diacylgycerolhomoserine-N-methlytransferase